MTAHSLHTARCAYPRPHRGHHADAAEQPVDLEPGQPDPNADYDVADWKIPSPHRVRGHGGDVLDTRRLEQAVYGVRWLLSHLIDDRLAAGGTLADFDPWEVAADRLATYPEPALAQVFGPLLPQPVRRRRRATALAARIRRILMRSWVATPPQLPIGQRAEVPAGEPFRPADGTDPSAWQALRGATIQYGHDAPSWDGRPHPILTGRVREVRQAGDIPLLVIASSAGRNVIDPRWWRITVVRYPRRRVLLAAFPAPCPALDDTGERR